MMAPCGIEIKIGQVWQKIGLQRWPCQWEVWFIGELVWLNSRYSGRSIRVPKNIFTGKRGGYKLVKEAQE